MTTPKQRRLAAELLQELYAQVDTLPKAALEALAPVLAQAQREIEKDLRAWLAREGGAERFTTQRLRRGLIQVRRTMERIKAGVHAPIVGGLRIGSNVAGQLATAHVAMELERFGAIFSGDAIAGAVAIDEAAVLAEGRKLLAHRFESSARRYSKAMRQKIASELAVSKLRGETMDEAAARLMARMPAVFNGLRWRADTLVRTELMHSYNVQHEAGVRQLRREDPEIRMRWDAYFDRRTCPICASLDGQIIDPEGSRRYRAEWMTPTKDGPRRHPTTRQHKSTHERPPAHPRCRCVLTAWKAEWAEDITREPAPNVDARPKPAGRPIHRAPRPQPVQRDLRPARGRMPVPRGFQTTLPRPRIKSGMPTFAELKRTPEGTLFAVDIGKLRRAGLYALPGGGDDRVRLAGVRKAWREGAKLPPLKLGIDRSGKLFIVDGRHRLLTALEGGVGIPRTMLVEFDRLAPGALEGTVALLR
jgi:hypothetical protein